MLLLARLGHYISKLAQDPFEECDNPLSVVESLGRHTVDGLLAILSVARAEVQRKNGFSTTSFQGGPLLMFVGQEVTKGRYQKRAEASSLLLGECYGVLLKEV